MTRSLTLLIAATLFGGQLASADEPAAKNRESIPSDYHELSAFAGRLTGSGVRLRAAPVLDSQIVGELDRGNLLIVKGEDHDFYAVEPPEGTKAYVYRTYVLDGKVEGSHVNVRLQPDVESPVLGQLNSGDLVTGTVCPKSSKWLEIEPPPQVKFYIAKEYVEKIGGPELVAERGKRLREVSHLLNSAYLVSQAELSKPFPEINIDRVISGFDQVAHDYSDLQEEAEKAARVLEMLRDVYGQKKAEFLETQVAANCTLWEEASAVLALELQDLCGQRSATEDSLLDRDEELLSDLDGTLEATQNWRELAPRALVHQDSVTDKMRNWEPVEDALYHLWAMNREEPSKGAFYSEQLLDEMALGEGVIERYTQVVKNRPGDYVLKMNNRPVAFLYSTAVDLEQKVGKQVSLKALERPNHEFAFPAYFITSVE